MRQKEAGSSVLPLRPAERQDAAGGRRKQEAASCRSVLPSGRMQQDAAGSLASCGKTLVEIQTIHAPLEVTTIIFESAVEVLN
jgi:hypothetical protein